MNSLLLQQCAGYSGWGRRGGGVQTLDENLNLQYSYRKHPGNVKVQVSPSERSILDSGDGYSSTPQNLTPDQYFQAPLASMTVLTPLASMTVY